YFTLKDAGSQVSAVLFRADAARARCNLRDGIQVVASGAVSVYEMRGNYQIIVRSIEADGVGRLQENFERLKRKLAAEGLFDPALKRRLPPLPRTVGIVTSPTGAALQDFLRILRRRDWRGRVVVLPVRVQGNEAAGEIAAALALAGRLGGFDLLVVARGGGSLEDLQPFNEEITARAVRAATVPIISAVGHEIDFTLSDFAADVRAETPSAAAELISSGFLACEERLGRARERLAGNTDRGVQPFTQHLRLLASKLDRHSPARRVETAWLRLDDLRNRLQSAPRHAANRLRQRLIELRSRLEAFTPENRVRVLALRLSTQADRLTSAARRRLERNTDRLAALEQRLRASGVDATLRRGFALVREDSTGRLLTTASAATGAGVLRIRFADGEVRGRNVCEQKND
ncbi:MAG: exodeoxyribonuclease VII large subunit, partial [Puniceicoccales bacterium]|nr:exodeoxyribonuclease VII large subunit [Puniceicoccales bacterium]